MARKERSSLCRLMGLFCLPVLEGVRVIGLLNAVKQIKNTEAYMPGSAGVHSAFLAATLGPFHAEGSTGHGKVGLNQPHQIGQTSVMWPCPSLGQGTRSLQSAFSQSDFKSKPCSRLSWWWAGGGRGFLLKLRGSAETLEKKPPKKSPWCSSRRFMIPGLSLSG